MCRITITQLSRRCLNMVSSVHVAAALCESGLQPAQAMNASEQSQLDSFNERGSPAAANMNAASLSVGRRLAKPLWLPESDAGMFTLARSEVLQCGRGRIDVQGSSDVDCH